MPAANAHGMDSLAGNVMAHRDRQDALHNASGLGVRTQSSLHKLGRKETDALSRVESMSKPHSFSSTPDDFHASLLLGKGRDAGKVSFDGGREGSADRTPQGRSVTTGGAAQNGNQMAGSMMRMISRRHSMGSKVVKNVVSE
jgi:hypothetical protein